MVWLNQAKFSDETSEYHLDGAYGNLVSLLD